MSSPRTSIPQALAGVALAMLVLSLVRTGARAPSASPSSFDEQGAGPNAALAAAPQQSAVPTPAIHCETPTPGPSPTSPAIFPDLVMMGMDIDLAPCRRCSKRGPDFGVVVEIGNEGGESPPFVVEVNGRRQAVGRMHHGQRVNLWFQGKPSGETVAVVDPDGSVHEFYGRSDNNVLRGVLPTPTWEPDLATCTPEPPSTAMPDLAIGSMSIALQPGWACGTPPVLGLHAEVANLGVRETGPFVAVLNGTPRAVGSLSEAGVREVFVPGYRHRAEQEVVVDPEDQVAELNESNNARKEMVPVPTLPPCPTYIATQTPTTPSTPATAEPSITATPTGSAPAPTASPTPTSTSGPSNARCYLPWTVSNQSPR